MPKKHQNRNGLNAQQQTFVDLWMADPEKNGTRAYRQAYPRCKSDDTARTNAARLLASANIQVYVQRRQDEILAKLREAYAVNEERVVAELAKIAFSDMTQFAEWGPGNVKLVQSEILNELQSPAVKEVRQSETQYGINITIRLHDKIRALELLGRKLGLFNDKLEVDVPDPLKELMRAVMANRDVVPPSVMRGEE